MKLLFFFVALLFAPFASAQEAERTREQAAAFLISQALAPAQYDWGTGWGPVSVRTARHMHWHLFEPDPRNREPDAIVRRNGWIDGPGYSLGVSVFGNDTNVTELSFEFARDVAGRGETLLEALAAEGVAVTAVRDEEDSGEYRIAAPEKRDATLLRQRECTSPYAAAAQRCWTIFTLRFDPIP